MIAKQRRVLLILEKPHQKKFFGPAWLEVFPDDELRYFYAPPIEVFNHDLPSELPISKVPMISEPRLKRGRTQLNRRSPTGFATFEEALAWCDKIVCATDPDIPGARHMEFLYSFYQVSVPKKEIALVWPRSWSGTDVVSEVRRSRSLVDPDFDYLSGLAQAKWYFDYNYAINALPVFSKCLRAAGVSTQYNFLSKYALLMLLVLHRQYHKIGKSWFSETELFVVMSKWKGSGRYDQQRIGSAISRSEIIGSLSKMGLLDEAPQGGRRKRYNLSPKGRTLASLMHKDVFDPDLPGRIEGWGESWPASKSKIDRYIRSLFGKQKRNMSRIDI